MLWYKLCYDISLCDGVNQYYGVNQCNGVIMFRKLSFVFALSKGGGGMHRPKKGPAFVMSGNCKMHICKCLYFLCRFFCVHNSRGVGEAGNTHDSNVFLGKCFEHLNIMAFASSVVL